MELNRTSARILKVLLENPLKEFKEIELINKSGTGKGSSSSSIEFLSKYNVINIKKIGKAKIISISLRSQYYLIFKNLFFQEKFYSMSDSRLAAIILFKNQIKKDVALMVIFGSSIAGTSTKESDIDVLIASNNLDKVNNERKKVEELFGERFNLHSYTEEEIRKNIKADEFIRNALLSGVLIYGYDLGMELLSNIGLEEKADIQRLIFLNERIGSAHRNYLNKDNKAALEVLEKTLEQIIFYLLSRKRVSYTSKKDAKEAIKKTAEGKLIEKIDKASLKDKITLSSKLILNTLKKEILKEEGYERRD